MKLEVSLSNTSLTLVDHDDVENILKGLESLFPFIMLCCELPVVTNYIKNLLLLCPLKDIDKSRKSSFTKAVRQVWALNHEKLEHDQSQARGTVM